MHLYDRNPILNAPKPFRYIPERLSYRTENSEVCYISNMRERDRIYSEILTELSGASDSS